MTISRNNHYIPQMYLSRWAIEGKVQVYRLLVSNENVPLWRKQSIEHTGSQHNLYVSILKDEEYDYIEHEFDTLIESPAKVPLDKICNSEKMTSDDWSKVSDYVCAQYVRTPAFYLWIKELGTTMLQEIINKVGLEIEKIKEIPKENRTNAPNAQLLPIGVRILDQKPDEDHSFVEIETVSGKGLWLFSIRQALDSNSELREYFQNLKWSVITAPDNEKWPTCDNPVVICDVTEKSVNRVPPASGIVGKTKAIIIPISPRIVLLAMSTRKFKWYLKADSIFAHDIKKAITNNAMMYIYSACEDESIPAIRPRIVDAKEFKRLKDDFDNWFDNYKEIEGPLLNN